MLKQQSKIILGTVQFGISYGISNNLGKTSKKNSLDILEYAYSNGIKYLDTAPSYGDSESVIGELNDKNYWRIISKTPSFSGNFITEESVEKLKEGIDDPGKIALLDKIIDNGNTVFEACSFQDITGQRITKVINTLKEIEGRVEKLIEAFGIEIAVFKEAEKQKNTEEEPEKEISDEDLLGGPQHAHEAKSQEEIDALLASFD